MRSNAGRGEFPSPRRHPLPRRFSGATSPLKGEVGAVDEPIAAPQFTLDELLAGVTRDNLHEEERLGPPVGREAL